MINGNETIHFENRNFVPFTCNSFLRRGDKVMKKVVKFGGSSLASAEQFIKVGKIILADESRRYVVPSAPGKRFDGDTKVTDMLYQCYYAAANGEDFSGMLKQIKARYNEIIGGLNLKLSLDEEFEVIAGKFTEKAGSDYAASRGEYLNGIVMAAYLGYPFVDAAEVIRFAEDGSFDPDVTDRLLGERLKEMPKAVVPGFYGAYEDGRIKTFSRGGSDITGSIVARASGADLYENWTDVSGFLVTDPRLIENPEVIDTITYRELRELSYMGATVLHEDAIFPVRKAGIPINIRNTNRPKDNGTMIVSSTCHKPRFTITGIAGKKGFVTVNIEKDMMNSEIGFGRKVLEEFEKQGISFEHIPSGIDTMSIVVHQEEFEEHEQKVLAGIQRAVHPDYLEVEGDLALIAVVGRAMRANRGTAGRIFSALAHANINVKMIDQGSSEWNIIVGVRNDDFERAIRAIYDIFITTQL
jgi:aspartate kinase